jgi:hypothetical protein
MKSIYGLIVVGFLAACGGESGAPPIVPETSGDEEDQVSASANESGDRTVSARVGPPGGSLALSNGARLEIPPGALEDTVEITFSVAEPTRSFSNREDIRLIGPCVMALPAVQAAAGEHFKLTGPIPSIPDGFSAEEVTLTVEVPAQDQREMHQSTQTLWDFIPASASGGRAEAELEALPGFRFQFAVSREDY